MNPSQKLNLVDLAFILNESNQNFGSAQRMKRDDTSSQESSFHNSPESGTFAGHRSPKKHLTIPSTQAEPQYRQQPKTDRTYENTFGGTSSYPVPQSERTGEDKASRRAIGVKIGPRLEKDREEVDPKLKALGSEIARRNRASRTSETEQLPPEQNIYEANQCQDCQMIRRKVPSKDQNTFSSDLLYCERHVPSSKNATNRSKSPLRDETGFRSDWNSTFEGSQGSPWKEKMNLKDTMTSKSIKDNLNRSLNMSGMDLDLPDDQKRISVQNKVLNQELERMTKEKGVLEARIKQMGQEHKVSLQEIDGLLERIKKHLGMDLQFYDKVQGRIDVNKVYEAPRSGLGKDWNDIKVEIPGIRGECEDVLRKIRERSWEMTDVVEPDSGAQVIEEKKFRLERVSVKAENIMYKDVVQKLDMHIKELEDQVNSLATESKNANKNNVMKVLELAKERKTIGVREAQLQMNLQDNVTQLEIQKHQLERNSISEMRIRELGRKKIEDLTLELQKKDKALETMKELLRKLRAVGLGSDIVIGDDIEETVKQVTMAIDNLQQSELKAKDYEHRYNKVVAVYEEEVKKGNHLAGLCRWYCQQILDMLDIFEANKEAYLPFGLKKLRDTLSQNHPRIQGNYEEIQKLLKEYSERPHMSQAQLSSNNGKPDIPNLNNERSQTFGQTKTGPNSIQSIAKLQGLGLENIDESGVRKILEENQDYTAQIDDQQKEIGVLNDKLTNTFQKIDELRKESSDLKRKYEAASKGKSSKKNGSEILNSSRILKDDRSRTTSLSIIYDADEMNSVKAKLTDNVDYLMMMHCQGLALEEQFKRVEQLEAFEKQAMRMSKRADNIRPTGLSKKFSFANDMM